MKKLRYNAEDIGDWITLKEGAKRASVSYARFRKALQRLEIPVKRAGWAVLVPKDAPARIRKAMLDGTIKPGRKKMGVTV